MNDIIHNIIKKVYLEKDHEYYREMCKKKIDIKNYFEELKYIEKLVEINLEDEPAVEYHFTLNKYKDISYKTILYISKIAPIFYIQHEFSVENSDPDKIEPVLDGFGGEPYNNKQNELGDYIKNLMNKMDYTEISYYDFNSCILSEKNNNLEILDGENYTTDSVLFNDMLYIND